MSERESRAEAETRRERRKALRCAIIGALVVLAPLAFAGAPFRIVAIVGAVLLLFYAGLVWFYALHAVEELVVFVLFISVCLTITLRNAMEQLRELQPERATAVDAPSGSTAPAAKVPRASKG